MNHFIYLYFTLYTKMHTILIVIEGDPSPSSYGQLVCRVNSCRRETLKSLTSNDILQFLLGDLNVVPGWRRYTIHPASSGSSQTCLEYPQREAFRRHPNQRLLQLIPLDDKEQLLYLELPAMMELINQFLRTSQPRNEGSLFQTLVWDFVLSIMIQT